jgi:hypothetical protein
MGVTIKTRPGHNPVTAGQPIPGLEYTYWPGEIMRKPSAARKLATLFTEKQFGFAVSV